MNDRMEEGPEYYYKYAPAGLFALSLFDGFLALGAFALILQCLTSWGIGPFIRTDHQAIIAGCIVGSVLILGSLLMGLLGYLAELKGKNLHTLWQLSKVAVPLVTVLMLIFAMVVDRSSSV